MEKNRDGENGGRAEYFPQEARQAKRSRNGFQSRRKATRRGLSEVGDDDRTLLTGRYGGRGWGCLAVHRAGLDRQAGRRSRCPGRRGSGACATQAPKPLPSGARVQCSVASRTVVDVQPSASGFPFDWQGRQSRRRVRGLESCLGCLSCADCIPGYGTTASRFARWSRRRPVLPWLGTFGHPGPNSLRRSTRNDTRNGAFGKSRSNAGMIPLSRPRRFGWGRPLSEARHRNRPHRWQAV